MRISYLVERALIALLLVAFLAPVTLTLAARCVTSPPRHFGWMKHPWFLGQSLSGMQSPQAPLEWTWDGVRSARLQQALATRFDTRFKGREALIRLSSQACFDLLRICATNSRIVVAPGDVLFEREYLSEYYLWRPTRESLSDLAENLARLQAVCDRRRQPLAFVITPSKVAISPELSPPGWAERLDPRPRGYDILTQLLKEKDVRFVDGRALTLDAKRTSGSRVPPFPRGGIHWGSGVAARSAKVLVDHLRERGLVCAPLEVESVVESDEPEPVDKDILELMNLWRPWKYPVAHAKVRRVNVPRPERRSMAFVGGSFMYAMTTLLSQTGAFSEIDTHFYYKLRKYAQSDAEFRELPDRASAFDFDRDIFAADALVLELNEQAIFDARALREFLKDALRHVDSPGITPRPFRFEMGAP